MKVNFSTAAKSNNFGMALHMNEAKIERKIGKEMADAARRARPELEELAKYCDMYVAPARFPSYAQFDNFLIRIIKERPIYSVWNYTTPKAIIKERAIAENLINTVRNLKASL